MKQPQFRYRNYARIVVEATTPLAIGTGQRNILTNRLVVTDFHGLPCIPGTSLAGIFRHALAVSLDIDFLNNLMGFQGEHQPDKNDEGLGSRLFISSAQMIGHDGKPVDGIDCNLADMFYQPFQDLPVRQHVRIGHRGAAEHRGKFDEQVVFKGTRFCFEMELLTNEEEDSHWRQVLNIIHTPMFRIGGGTRKGFGELTVKDCRELTLDMLASSGLQQFLSKTSSLNDECWKMKAQKPTNNLNGTDMIEYELQIRPDDFFLFSSGLENGEIKINPVTEKIVEWSPNANGVDIPHFSEEKILIPATSVKGALAHRVAFHFNKNHKVFADALNEDKLKALQYSFKVNHKNNEERLQVIATKGNPAVRELFGCAENDEEKQRGRVISSDIIECTPATENRKLFNHVAIDRFTGGSMEGALFSEEVIYTPKTDYRLKFWVEAGIENDYMKAFEEALQDIADGMLPLGGGTMRGHGIFRGTVKKNKQELKNEQN